MGNYVAQVCGGDKSVTERS